MTLNENKIGARVESLRSSKVAEIDRQHKYLSKRKLCNELNLNVEEYDLMIEGKKTFKVKTLFKIARLYKVSSHYIIFGGIK